MNRVFLLTFALLGFFLTVFADLDKGLRSDDPEKRREALVVLLSRDPQAETGYPDSVLRGPLYDEDVSVRLAAIAVLEHRKVASFNEDLVCLLQQASSPVRAAAAKALGLLGNKTEVTVPLWRSLADEDREVRREAIRAIDLLHGTAMGFYWDQDPKEYRWRAQEALREYLEIDPAKSPSHTHSKKW
jgi:hypothetical protein